MKLKCTLPQEIRSYDIVIERGILASPPLPPATRYAIITDDRVGGLYGEKLKIPHSQLFVFPQGEASKSRETKERVENALFEHGFGRDSCIIALGGGVVTDVAGYVASTYCRGIPLVMIPTSLLAMVDASIGGKTGVDTPYGKNMIGTLYQPHSVLIDTETLKTLPKKELSHGVVEMIKHGLIIDEQLFYFLEEHLSQIMSLDLPIVEKAIAESCRIKKEIVEADEQEKGQRRLVNFGHTIGHALEKLSHYTLPHGEAVAIGMVTEAYLAYQLGAIERHIIDRIKEILWKYGLSLRLPALCDPETLVVAMSLDKKSKDLRPRFVILDAIGSCLPYDSQYCTTVAPELLHKTLHWMNSCFASS